MCKQLIPTFRSNPVKETPTGGSSWPTDRQFLPDRNPVAFLFTSSKVTKHGRNDGLTSIPNENESAPSYKYGRSLLQIRTAQDRAW